MSEKDGLPKTICTECAEKLEDFYNFRELSRKTESNLGELLHSDNNRSDSECSNSKTSDTSKNKGTGSFQNYFLGRCFQGHCPEIGPLFRCSYRIKQMIVTALMQQLCHTNIPVSHVLWCSTSPNVLNLIKFKPVFHPPPSWPL